MRRHVSSVRLNRWQELVDQRMGCLVSIWLQLSVLCVKIPCCQKFCSLCLFCKGNQCKKTSWEINCGIDFVTFVSRKPQYKDVYRRIIEMPQRARTFQVNYCLKVHNAHPKFARLRCETPHKLQCISTLHKLYWYVAIAFIRVFP